MLHGESSCLGGSEYVWEGGEGVIKAELRAAKVNHHFKKNGKCGAKKNIYCCNFRNIVSKTNERWFITNEKLLIHFGTDILKIMAGSVFLTPHIFANGLHLVFGIPQSFQGYPKSRPGVIGLASSTLQRQHNRKVVHDF